MGSYIDIPSADGSFRAYLARPAAASAPAVVVNQEIFGINADLRATCDTLAAQGWLAVCPDLFWRFRPGIELSHLSADDWKTAIGYYTKLDLDKAVADVAATVQAARTLPGATGKVGVMGFCLGGLLTFLTAARHGADAAVEYYGGRTEEFLGEAAAIRSPLLIHLAGDDEYMTKDAQRRIAEAVRGNPAVELHVYAGCNHAFARHDGTHYDAAAATLANGRTRAFFERHLA